MSAARGVENAASPPSSGGNRAPIIAHADMDAFYVEAELLDKPELHGQKIIVAGDGRSVVLSASYAARADGVRSAMPLARARQLSPESTVLPPQMSRYRELSQGIMAYFATLTDRVEQLSVDEAFLDLTGAQRRLGSPEQMGQMIRTDIRQQFDLPVTVGMADRKFIAKIASTHAKPDGLLLVPPVQRVAFLHSLPVTALWGVGQKTAQSLADFGLRTVEQLAHTPRDALTRRFGALGEQLHGLAWGQDPRAVEPVREEKSIGAEETFEADIDSTEELDRELLRLAHRVAARLRAAGLQASGVALKLRFNNFTTLSRSSTLAHPTQSAAELHRRAIGLLHAEGTRPHPVRLVGVRAERLSAEDGALQLSFDAHDDEQLAAERALDAVVGRFPTAVTGPASLISPRRNTEESGPEDTAPPDIAP